MKAIILKLNLKSMPSISVATSQELQEVDDKVIQLNIKVEELVLQIEALRTKLEELEAKVKS